MAQLNGGVGTASPSWNGTDTLTDNQITVKIVPAVASSSGYALKVSFQKNIPATLSRAFSATASYTVTGSSTAELVATTGTFSGGGGAGGGSGGGQPCLVALGNGLTSGTDLTIQGSVTVNTPTCTIRSNDGAYLSGSSTVYTQGIFAGGTITNSGSSNIFGPGPPGPMYSNQGQIPDPYAGNTALQSALTAANSATGTGNISCKGNSNSTTCTGPSNSFSCSGTSCTLQPGTYTGLNLTSGAILNFSPGRYVFTDTINLGGGSTVIGSGVTVLQAAGTSRAPKTMSVDGNAVFVLTPAATADATNGQIPGVVFASRSVGTTSVYTGNSTNPFVGIIYYPKGQITYLGSSYSGSPGCGEVIAKTISMNGNATFDASTCASYGATSFNSLPTVLSARLVK
jgi:hypothetical protein